MNFQEALENPVLPQGTWPLSPFAGKAINSLLDLNVGVSALWGTVTCALCLGADRGRSGRQDRSCPGSAQQEQMGQAQMERQMRKTGLIGELMNRRKLILQKVEWPDATISKIFA